MTFTKAPFGFYDLEKISHCVLSGTASKIGFGKWTPEDPPTKQVIIGRFYHDLMESEYKDSNSNEDYEYCIKLIEKYNALAANYPSLKILGKVSGWKEINAAARMYLEGNFRGRKRAVDVSPNMKGNLYSQSKLLIGKPDSLKIDGTKGFLTEFKSTSIYKDEVVQEKYVRQLKYYSYLVFSNFDVTVIECKLISLNGHEVLVPISKEEAMLYGKECEDLAVSTWEKLDQTSDLLSLSTPGNPQCKECRIKAACRTFLSTQDDQVELEGFRVAKGILKAIEDNENSFKLILSDCEIQIQNVSDTQKSDLKNLQGKEIVISNCKGNKGKFHSTLNSVIKAIE